ncbi:hypothetical protein SCARR_00384 [Pontiella sulfatireligans]|uniref:Uncharacterized protein n=1 Tax=Pontiella sulfatireligans TaxID=2750658 RepID=A0A6C2UDP9_9BACT|nr:hypothetical protein SCARR_00384 [Pontiella sulfatireligans]
MNHYFKDHKDMKSQRCGNQNLCFFASSRSELILDEKEIQG